MVFTGTEGIFGIAIDPNHSEVVYFGTVGAGAFKSSNAGSSWTAMTTLTPRVIWTVAVDPADSQVVYAGSNEDGVWKSGCGRKLVARHQRISSLPSMRSP